MANRKPRPGDRALLLPPLRGGDEYEGTICQVHEECWEVNRGAHRIIEMAKRLTPDRPIESAVDLNKPFWHCTLMDGRFAHVHEDNLEPIDPDSDEEDRDTRNYDPRNVKVTVDGTPIEPVEA